MFKKLFKTTINILCMLSSIIILPEMGEDLQLTTSQLIANKLVGSEEVSKMVNYHDQGFLLGPVPAYTTDLEGKNNE